MKLKLVMTVIFLISLFNSILPEEERKIGVISTSCCVSFHLKINPKSPFTFKTLIGG